MTRIFHEIVFLTAACCVGAATTYAFDDAQTVREIVEKIRGQPAAQPDGASSKSKQSPASTPENCPDPAALDLFKYQIVFEGTEEAGALKGLGVIHTDVWERGNSTAFYVREPLPEFSTDVRMVYLFDKEAMDGGGGCPAEQAWTECVEKADKDAEAEATGSIVRTCTTTIDIRALPAWKPSPDSPEKRRVADELRNEIEVKWKGVHEIVVRDFNLRDPQITMYLKMPDGVYFQGCSFYSGRQTVCDHWHMFGQAPLSSLRKWVFDKPYRLK